MKPTILFVGCPTTERPDVERQLAAAGLIVVWIDSPASAIAELKSADVPVLVDMTRGAAALQNIRDIRAQSASAAIFAVVDPRRPDLTAEAVLAGVADVFARPISGRRVAAAIAREQNRDASKCTVPGDLYGHSPAMHDVMALVARAATMRTGVMIRGEDGTGRQVAARAIHAAQNGKAGPFVSINCAAYDPEELDGVLFGPPVNGPRSTGAAAGFERVSKKGVLHESRNGTLYLQNVAELPARVQARLARVLRDREVVLAETGDTIAFDMRPMTGVDPHFDAVVEEGRVREDLFKRLSATRIDMPPLRNRREDIPPIANCLLRDICARQGVPPKTLSRPALSLIAALPWRGNAAELQGLLDSIVTSLQGGRNIGLEDVLAHVRLDGGPAVFTHAGTLKQARTKFEREYIAAVLDQKQGKISDAARTLGIQRTNLYRKMRSLSIKKTP